MRKKKKRKGKKKNHLAIFFTVIFFFAAVGVIGASGWIRQNFKMHLPDEFFSLSSLGKSPQFYWYEFEDRQNRIGSEQELTVGGFEQKKTTYIEYQEIPQSLIDAFVSIEDKRFYQHNGVDWYRTLAASVNYLLGGSKQFGASTITQQLVKNITGNNEIAPSRKIQEIFYALDLERQLDKTQIMELYLNIIHFSDNCNGIAEASMHYFGKEVSDLTVEECATIAAITNNPSYYNPIRHPENNQTRRDLILREMYAQHYLSEETYQSAVSTPVSLQVTDQSNTQGMNSWYVDMVLEDVIGDLMKQYDFSRSAASTLVYRGGLRIDIAMDPKIQALAEDYYENVIKTPVNQDGIHAQSAIILLDSRTGDILAVVGAIGEKKGNRIQNFATQTKRPPGSVIKPISVYGPALEEGLIDWSTVLDDVPVNFGTDGKHAWPKNATGVYRGLTNIAYAVAHSTNTISVQVLERLGLNTSFDYAKNKFHLTGMIDESGITDRDIAALSLGQLNYGVTLRELTTAYTVFADGGVYHPYRSYYRVQSSDGRVLLSNAASSEPVLSEGNAAIMTKLLQGVVERGTSSSITLNQLVECAGKTGTTNQDGDRWFVGYTPDVICGVWCGYEYPEPLEGSNLCTQIWNQIMKSVWDERGGRSRFSVPSSVVQAGYCKDSGDLMSENCLLDPRGNREEIGWFLADRLPQTHCECHVLCDYDTENHGISHGFCPDDTLKRVALINVKRSFPMQILVTDAQYVYQGNPLIIDPNAVLSKSYYDQQSGVYHGISYVERPFNASCPMHQQEQLPDWEYLIPKFYPQKPA